MMPPVHVDGIGLWAPGFRDLAAWRAGQADPAVVEPSATLLTEALRRRASGLTRMAAEVAAQAVGQAGASQVDVPLVLGSALGEIACAAGIIGSFGDPGGLPSPTRFHNSVHNTAVGYLSIATGNRLGATALAAGAATTAMALVEAATQLAERGAAVVLMLADERLPPTLQEWGTYQSAAVAFHLTAEPTARTVARLTGLRRGPAAAPALPAGWRDHPCAGGLALAAAIGSARGGPCGLGPWGDESWIVDLAAVPS